MNLTDYLYDSIRPVLQSWDEEGIYALSFFVYANEANSYEGFSNFPELSVGYNTEEDCGHAPLTSEERWNFAFWRQDMTCIIGPEAREGARVLLQWYRENGIAAPGVEEFNEERDYDQEGHYIGKGPAGYLELLDAAAEAARRLQLDGIIASQFGPIPIIVHELEYPWYVREATARANPNGEAAAFLRALEEW